MKTAIITGASAGLGREFALQTLQQFPDIECFWLVARRAERLEALAKELAPKTVKCLALDLCKEEDLNNLEQQLAAEKPQIDLLINNSGCGYLGNLGEMETCTQTRIVDLNIRALTAVTNMVLPYVIRGGKLVFVSSIASFCPNPRMTVYSSSKAYVSAFAAGLREEVAARGIAVTVTCPGPMKTEFLDIGGISGNSKTFETLPYCDPVKVVSGTLRAAKAGRGVYTPRFFYKFYRVLAKLLPQRLMIKLAKT